MLKRWRRWNDAEKLGGVSYTIHNQLVVIIKLLLFALRTEHFGLLTAMQQSNSFFSCYYYIKLLFAISTLAHTYQRHYNSSLHSHLVRGGSNLTRTHIRLRKPFDVSKSALSLSCG